jgi:regulator of sigma E protease
LKRNLTGHQKAVIGAVTDESTNKDLQAKDVVVTLMVAAKYIDQAKLY